MIICCKVSYKYLTRKNYASISDIFLKLCHEPGFQDIDKTIAKLKKQKMYTRIISW